MRRTKTTPCRCRPPPLLPVTSRHLPSQWRVPHPAARQRVPASGAWRKCHISSPLCKVGGFLLVITVGHPAVSKVFALNSDFFIHPLPSLRFAGCEDLASQFLSQEIDGQALLLLKEEHLMTTMNIKLGPALKICAHINSLKD